ncbi:MAG: helix-turn-helix domain-containing protein [Parcubacteria group bacterium]
MIEQHYSASALAKLLGVHVSTVRTYTDLPSFMVNGRRLYAESDIKAWLKKHRQEPTENVVQLRDKMRPSTTGRSACR